MWDEGASNGGTPVFEYRIWYAEETALSWNVLEGAYTQTTKTQSGLGSGLNFKFRVEARNLVGYSEYSEEIVIRAAELPFTPTNVQTSVSGTNVVVSWTAPYDGGSPVHEYVVMVR